MRRSPASVGEPLGALVTPPGQEALHHEAVGRAGRSPTTAATAAAGPGTTRHRMAAVDGRPHQPLARIRDARRAGVGHDGDGRARGEEATDLRRGRGLRVLVGDDQAPLGHARVLQQASRAPGVLADDDVGLRERG